MSKRFTETNIWSEDWFLELPKNYKLLYFYIKDNCDHAGIWRPNLRLFEAIIEDKVDLKLAIELFNNGKNRIQILNCGRWFLLDFFVFQYGTTFNCQNRVHKSIQSIYNQLNINLTSIRGLKEVKGDLKEGVKDKDKDKDIDKDIVSINNKKESIKNLCKKEKYEDVMTAFETWRDYLNKQHSVTIQETGYAYDILLDAISRVKDGNVIKSINHSIASNFKRIYASKEDINNNNPLAHLNQAAKRDSDF